MRVLIVEDEAMVAMTIEDMLTDLGFEVVGPAMRLEAALYLAREGEFDLAILDVNLGGVTSFPVADVLAARGIPFLFATGYGRAGLDGRFPAAVVLWKPFASGSLANALAEVLARSGT